MTDELDRTGAGSHGDLAALYRHYSAWLRSRLVRRYGSQEADEIAQETWLRLAPNVALRDIRHPRAFLMTVAAHLATDRALKRDRRARLVAQVGHLEGKQVAPATQTDAVLVKEIILGLPEPLRYVASVIDCYLALTAGQGPLNSRQCRSRSAP